MMERLGASRKAKNQMTRNLKVEEAVGRKSKGQKKNLQTMLFSALLLTAT